MCMLRLGHLMAIVPISVLLTVSFFVLFTLRKIEEKWLKSFGYLVAALLWLAALVVFSGAVYKLAQGAVATRYTKQPRMKRDYLPQMVQRNNPPAMVRSEKHPLVQDQKRPGCSKCQGNKGVIFKAE